MLISDALAQDPTADTTTSIEAAPPADVANAPYELSQEKMFKDTMVFLLLLFIVFYFVLIRPQQKKFKAHQSMLGELQKGEEIITGGGLIGRISKFEGNDIVVVEVADKVQVRVARSSVSGRYFPADEPSQAKTLKSAKSNKTANDN